MKSLFLLILGFQATAFAGWTLVNHGVAISGDHVNVTVSGLNTTGSDTLVVFASPNPVQNSVTMSISDSHTGCASPCNTWTRPSFPSNYVASLWYVTNASVGTSASFTVSCSGNCYSVLFVAAFSGGPSSSAVDQLNANNINGVASIGPGSVTTTASGDLLVAVESVNNTSGTVSINSSFTITDQVSGTGGNNYGGALAYLVQSSAGAVNPTWTYANTVSTTDAGIISFFKSGGFVPQIGAFAIGP